MSDKVFLDSNLWVYLLGKEDEKKRPVIDDMTDRLNIVFTIQTVNEVTAVLSGKMKGKQKKFGFNNEKIRDIINFLYDYFEYVNTTQQTFLKAADFREKHGFHFWDSHLLAVAYESGCTVFYSEDGQDGFTFDNGMQIINPFNML